VLPVAPVRVQPGTAEELAAGAGIAAATDAIDEAHQGEIDAHVDPESVTAESVDPESPEAEYLADQAATAAEAGAPAEGAAETDESSFDATLEEPTNDEAQGDAEAPVDPDAATEGFESPADPETTAGAMSEEDLAIAGDDPEAGEAFEPAPTATAELAAEENLEPETETLARTDTPAEPSDSIDTPWDTLAGGQSTPEPDAATDDHAAGEPAASSEEATDFDLTEDDLAEIARELADDNADEASRNGRGHGADPKNRM
jgi:hypothetical protein